MIRRSLFLLLPLALLLGGCLDRELPTALPPGGAAFDQSPASPVVNSLDDDAEGCTAEKCTLRAAIAFAGDGAEIAFAAALSGQTITLASQLEIHSNLTITGPADGITISGNNDVRVMRVFSGSVRLDNLTVTRGAEYMGGGIFNSGLLTVANSTVLANSASFGGGIANFGGTLHLVNSTVAENQANPPSFGNNAAGAGIYNVGTLTIDNSTIWGNAANTPILASIGTGGGISNTGTLTITHSTIWGNGAGTSGGGIDNHGTLAITNSTLWNNAADQSGGIYNGPDGTLTILHTTITANRGWSSYGGIYNDADASLTLRNSIVALNVASMDPDLSGSFGGTHNLIGVDPGLELDNGGRPKLADNGGVTRTVALVAGSAAIDAAEAAHCPTTDQRGVSRPQGSGCDIGAFELQQATTPVFGGFLPPLRPEQLNVVKAGRAVPVKFSLGGDFGLNILASGYPTSVQIACPAANVARSTVSGTTTARESRLSYDAAADQYNYLWVTEKGWAGTCRRFEVRFIEDPNTYTLDFSFTR